MTRSDSRPARLLRPLAAAVLLAGAFTLGYFVRDPAAGAQERTDPASLRPTAGRRGVEPRLVAGETHLLKFLQLYCDYIGQAVYIEGAIPPTATVEISKRMRTLQPQAVTEFLASQGYEMSLEDLRGKRVWWVQKELNRPTKKGSLTPSKQRGQATPDGESSAAPAVDKGRSGGSAPGLCIYRREDGTGSTFVVLFESDSRQEAAAAFSLLEAHRRGSRR